MKFYVRSTGSTEALKKGKPQNSLKFEQFPTSYVNFLHGAAPLTCDERRERHRQQQRRTPETQTIHVLHPRFRLQGSANNPAASPGNTHIARLFLIRDFFLSHGAARGNATLSFCEEDGAHG